MAHVWVTLDTPEDCSCWRDAVCTHGLSWQWGDPPCAHIESYEELTVSLADAIRNLFSREGAEAIGYVLREPFDRERPGRRRVYVMRAGPEPIDDHDANGLPQSDGPRPMAVIDRYRIVQRTTPRVDPSGLRALADGYRRPMKDGDLVSHA